MTYSLLTLENNDVIFNVSQTKMLSINHLRDVLLPSVSMADSRLQVSDLLRLLWLTFADVIRFKGYIESLDISEPKKNFFTVSC